MRFDSDRLYLTPKQFSAKHPTFSETWLRWRLLNRESNGMARAIRKIGRSILIDEEAFFEWIESHAEQNDGI